MVCPKCGKETSNSTKFCTQCGSKIEDLAVVENNEINTNNVDNNLDKKDNTDGIGENVEYVNNIHSDSIEDSSVNKVVSDNGKKNTSLIIILVIALVIAIVGISAVILWKVNSNKVNGNNVNSNNYINTNTNDSNNKNNNKVNNNSNSNEKTNNGTNLNKSNDSLEKIDNYNVDIDMTMEVSDVAVKVKFTGTVDNKNQNEYLKMSMEMFGFNVSSETYTDLKNGISYILEPVTGDWIKEQGSSQIVDLNGLLDSLESMENVDKIDDNHFKIKITSDDIKGMLEATDADIKDITGDIFADVYTNNGYIEQIIYNFSNLSEELGEFSINMKISNYNKAGDVIIPNDVIESATED